VVARQERSVQYILVVENCLLTGAFVPGRINKGYEEICQVEADLSGMRQALKKKMGRDGDYYYLDFTMALQFGGTELQAFVEWEQDVSYLQCYAFAIC
jgi:hypothetical protein